MSTTCYNLPAHTITLQLSVQTQIRSSVGLLFTYIYKDVRLCVIYPKEMFPLPRMNWHQQAFDARQSLSCKSTCFSLWSLSMPPGVFKTSSCHTALSRTHIRGHTPTSASTNCHVIGDNPIARLRSGRRRARPVNEWPATKMQNFIQHGLIVKNLRQTTHSNSLTNVVMCTSGMFPNAS